MANQLIIQKWLAIVLLKNCFGGSSDTTLKELRDALNAQTDLSTFPYEAINKKLSIEAGFSGTEIENFLKTNYGTKYSYLILSLLYPNRDWKDSTHHEDHIFPKSQFTARNLIHLGYDAIKTQEYLAGYNTIANLQLLTDSENLEKHAKPFDEWLATRDDNFRTRHSIPSLRTYAFDNFMEFFQKRKKIIETKLKTSLM